MSNQAPPVDTAETRKGLRPLLSLLVWIVRIAVGGAFIYSGFVKGIDPWGTIYKLQDYLGAMGISLWPTLTVLSAFLLCAFEFVVGALLITGSFRKSAPVLMLLFMAVMLPLTLWIAVSNPVSDCGCFGDAWKISNTATFWKNVVLTALIIFLLKFNRRAGCLVTPALQWIAVVVSGVYLILVAAYGYYVQPMIDFRPFAVGTSIIPANAAEDEDEAAGIVFIYSRDGVEKEFSSDDTLPDEEDGWEFVRREERFLTVKNEQSAPHEGEFRIWSRDGEEDVTADVLSDSGDQMMLLMPELSETSVSSTWRLNALAQWCRKSDIGIFAVVAGSPEEIDAFEDITMPSYNIYTAEDTSIKEVARCNPAVVFIRDGKIQWKSSLRTIDVDYLTDSPEPVDPATLAKPDGDYLNRLTLLYLAAIGLLIAISFIPDLFRLPGRLIRRGRLTRDGKVRHGESCEPGKSAPQKTDGPSRD